MGIIENIDDAISKGHKEIERIKRRIKRLEEKKEILLSLPNICPSCRGSGRERYTDAAGSGDWRDCSTCRGLGKIGPIECDCGKVIGTDMIRIRQATFPECPWCGKSLGGQYRINF